MTPPRLIASTLSATLSTVAASCTSFTTVRSADVRPGPSLTAQVSMTTSPGPVAGWLWSFDCSENCDDSIKGLDVTFMYGRRKSTAAPHAVGFGLNGTFPFAEGYLQLRDSDRLPFGVGARVGIPFGPGWQNGVYGRLDIPLASNAKLLWNPGLFHNSTSSPNGANHGWFVGVVQGVGLELGTGSITFTPSAALVWGRAEYENPNQHGPEDRLFGTGALSVTFGRKVTRASR
jgi:hypothetical protein